MTPFGLLIDLCGLSQSEAESYFGISRSSVQDYVRGTRPKMDGTDRIVRCPTGILAEARALWTAIDQAADKFVEAWREHPISPLEIGYAADDHEARSLGWPCVGAQRTAFALALTRLPGDVEVLLVPRGSTPSTAAAADAHGR